MSSSSLAAEVALCFATSTLELGIDIGDIDVVLLIGPPGSPASFTQRIGRGNRRGRSVRAACGYRTPLERLLFETLIAEPLPLAPSPAPTRRKGSGPPPFRPSVAVQQIFSLLKQSPTAALRRAPLAQLFAGLLAEADLAALLGHLQQSGYLQAGRPGEWRAGPKLNKLFDQQSAQYVDLSIFSNIQSAGTPPVAIRDQHTGQTLAMVDALWLDREELTFEGRQIDVAWNDGEALWINSRPGGEGAPTAIYRSGRQLLSYELAGLLPARLGLAPGEAALLPAPSGAWLFHWLGDLYGRALRDLLRYTLPAEDGPAPGLALHLPQPPRALPALGKDQVRRYLSDSYRQYEPLLDLGAFQQLLPTPLRRRAVADLFDVPRFLAAAGALRPAPAPEEIAGQLADLLG